MKILFLTTHLNSGGITSYLLTLTQGLIKQGQNVYLGSRGGNMSQEFLRCGCRLISLNIRTKSELDPRIYWSLGQLNRLILKEGIDLIHSHTRITQVMGFLLARLTKKTYLTTCHGYFKTRLVRRIFPCWGEAVIAISPAVQSHLEKDFRVPSEKICLIKTGLDIRDFPFNDLALKSKKRRELSLDNSPVIGIIARLSQEKGHQILIEAMKRIQESIPNVRLMIVGGGRLKRNLKKLVEDLDLKESILFYPVVNQTREFLSIFDCFVMPSLQEGLGLSVMEAQACGLPVVATRVGGIPSLIEHEKTGFLVEPQDSAGLARAIIKILKDPIKAQEMGSLARQFIEKEFSSEQMVNKTMDLYNRLLKSKTGFTGSG